MLFHLTQMRFPGLTHLLMWLSLGTLSPIIRAGEPILVELIDLVGSVIIFLSQNNLTQMVNFPMDWIYLFLLAPIFVLQWLPLHWEILIMFSLSMDFLTNSKQDALFHCMTILMLIRMAFVSMGEYHWIYASGFCKWAQVGIDVYILHLKYQVKPDSSWWFSGACVAAMLRRNHFFRLYQQ